MKHLLIASSVCLCLLVTVVMAPGIETPGVVTLQSLQDKYEPVIFDHNMHTFVTESCAQCHHEHGSGNARCSWCHSLDSIQFRVSVVQSFLACKICHGDLDTENPGMPSLKVAYHEKCFPCHKDMGGVGNGPEGCTEQCHQKASQ